MSEQIKQIAARIKDLREISALSVEELAAALNISKETYEEYENGRADIPISFLIELANKYHVELAAILTGDGPKLHSYSVVRKGKGVNVDRRKQYKYQSLAYNFIHKKAEPFLVIVEPTPDSETVNYSSHHGQEFNFVIEGTLKVVLNGHEVILNEGDSLYFDSGINHGMKAVGGSAAKFLAVVL